MLSLALVSLAIWYLISSVVAWWKLRKFPTASWLSNFSYLWLAKTTYSGRLYWVHRELHHEHKLVRVGPNELITGDPDIIRRINKERSGYHRGAWYTGGRLNPYYDNMFSLQQPAAHTKYKSRVAHGYSGREIPDLEIGMDEQIRMLLGVMSDRYARPGRHLELAQVTAFFTMDVITRLAFGEAFGYLKQETDLYGFLGSLRVLWPGTSAAADVSWARKILFSKPFLKLLGPSPRDKTGFGALMGVAEHHVAKRFRPDAEQVMDMLGSFIHHGLSQQECEVEGLFMIIAGSESTASAIRSILVHTMTTPRVYVKLKAEIKAALDEDTVTSPIQMERALKLPYLQAVVYEGLRMRPPVLGLLPKVVPAGGDTLGGQWVPGGTNICSNTGALLRSRSLFGPDADVFRPERFTELEAGPVRREMERSVEFAFGSGQWQCVGRRIALMKLSKTVFEVFRNFDLQLLSPIKP
ncbi:Cytochrome P450 monooxygenase aba1 [Diaporthe australafricana]|uniref:Cytochrome P450 monooxygenase aba1 n=1 Tax=Diaporthe australafricana TaxID=127596 RepID=A0ABR3Y3N6_9PEZI